MTKASNPIPEGYHSITPSLIVKDVAQSLEFYKRAFGATELFKMTGPDGKTLMFAEIKIGDSMLRLGPEMSGCDSKSAETLKGSPVAFSFYINDVDKAFKTAIEAGARETEAPSEQFWGDRMGTVADPFGYQWSIASRQENLSVAEIYERAQVFFAKKAA